MFDKENNHFIQTARLYTKSYLQLLRINIKINWWKKSRTTGEKKIDSTFFCNFL